MPTISVRKDSQAHSLFVFWREEMAAFGWGRRMVWTDGKTDRSPFIAALEKK